MRLCTTCGSRFSNDARFCPHDGEPTELHAEPAEPLSPWLGRVIDGRYEVQGVLGEGGMGRVYAVRHVTLGKRMAMKVLKPELAGDQTVVDRFLREAQATTAIGHPNIVDVVDFGRMSSGEVYFVMEHLDGESLAERMKRGGLGLDDAIDIVMQAASALGAAHGAGVVHRDVKPDNIFVLSRAGHPNFVKVLDFGIAKVASAPSSITRTGIVFGTPQYIAPEQAAGQKVDARADVYALGVVLYEILAGAVPFDDATFMGIVAKHLFEAPRPPLDRGALPDAAPYQPIVMRALEKSPDARHQSMEELYLDLERVRSGGVSASVPPAPSLQGRRVEASARRPAWTFYMVGVLALFGVGAIVGAVVALLPVGAQVSEAPARMAASPPTAPSAAVAPASTAAAPSAAEGVQLSSEPAGALVIVAGALIGRTPLALPASLGETTSLTLRLAGHTEHTLPGAALAAGEPIHVALTPVAEPPRPAPSTATARAPARAPATRDTAPRVAPEPAAAPPPAPAPAPRPIQDLALIDPWP